MWKFHMETNKPMKRFPEGEVSYGDDAILLVKHFHVEISFRDNTIMTSRCFKPMNHFPDGEISHGQVAILSEKRFKLMKRFPSYGDHDHPAFVHGDVREILVTWFKYHRHHHKDDNDDDKKSRFLCKKHDRFGNERFKKHICSGKGKEEERDEKKKAHEERAKGGFLNRIRKFFNHFRF